MGLVAKVLFWLALLFALGMAIIKHPPPIPGDPSDKLQHITAFVVLSVLAAWAYPRRSPLAILLGLVMFGGLIELIQSIPAIGRDADARDWAADGIAVVATLVVISGVQRLRRRLRREPPTE